MAEPAPLWGEPEPPGRSPSIDYDPIARAGYCFVWPDVPVDRTVELSPAIWLDLAADGRLVGIRTVDVAPNYATLLAVLRHVRPGDNE